MDSVEQAVHQLLNTSQDCCKACHPVAAISPRVKLGKRMLRACRANSVSDCSVSGGQPSKAARGTGRRSATPCCAS